MKKLILIGLCLCIFACATSYKKGISDTQINDTSFEVSFHGNQNTPVQNVYDYCLLRSAELAINNGYEYFIIVNSYNVSSERSYLIPGSSTTKTLITKEYDGYSIESKSDYEESHVVTKYYPAIKFIIYLSQYNLTEKGYFSYNAKRIMESMIKKYKLNKELNHD